MSLPGLRNSMFIPWYLIYFLLKFKKNDNFSFWNVNYAELNDKMAFIFNHTTGTLHEWRLPTLHSSSANFRESVGLTE